MNYMNHTIDAFKALASERRRELLNDNAKWHTFVYQLKQESPELFKYVTFDMGNPEVPYSEGADHVYHVMMQTGMIRTAVGESTDG